VIPGAALAHRCRVLPRNLCMELFTNADIVVQAVMVGLAFASLVTWTIWLAKTSRSGARRDARRRLGLLETTPCCRCRKAIPCGDDAVAQIVQSAAREASLPVHADDASRSGSRCGWSGSGRDVAADCARHRVLATIGATAPLSLFGTVWAYEFLHRHFRGAHTNLAVVAPGSGGAARDGAGMIARSRVVIYNHLSVRSRRIARCS